MRNATRMIATIMAFGALSIASPALADPIPNDYDATFNSTNVGQPIIISFNGISDGAELPGLSMDLTLTLLSIAGNTFTFDFDVFNSSGMPWDAARVTGFGFDVDPTILSRTLTSSTFGYIGSGNYPDNGLLDHSVEVCFTNNKNENCSGSKGGVAIGDTGDGIFTLTFAPDAPVTEITLSGFITRYQGMTSDQQGLTNVGSATGIPMIPGVPEPTTWAMMLLGFGIMGSAIRRRRVGVLTRAVA